MALWHCPGLEGGSGLRGPLCPPPFLLEPTPLVPYCVRPEHRLTQGSHLPGRWQRERRGWGGIAPSLKVGAVASDETWVPILTPLPPTEASDPLLHKKLESPLSISWSQQEAPAPGLAGP